MKIAPDDVLEPGTGDARRLLILWIVRQSAVPVLWLGLIVAVQIAPGNEIQVTFESTEDAFRELGTPAAAIALAILIRMGTSFAGFALALPLTRGFGAAGHAPGRYSGRRLDRFFDHLFIARGYRSLRFTRYVRDAAVARVGDEAFPYDRIDSGFRIAGFVLPVVTVLVAVLA